MSLNDIKKVFGDLTIFNRKVVDWWTQNPNFKSLLRKWNENRKLIREGKIYDFLANNFRLANGDNPLLIKYLAYFKNTINAFLFLNDEYDFSYLFTEKDKDFILRHFQLDEE